jgi:hypothetical protein
MLTLSCACGSVHAAVLQAVPPWHAAQPQQHCGMQHGQATKTHQGAQWLACTTARTRNQQQTKLLLPSCP